jgi:hypothetical protein
MKTAIFYFSAFRGLALILAFLFTMSACDAAGNTWKEEVLLHDGRKIIVERSQTYGGRSEPGQSGPIREHSISFRLPGSSKAISWTSSYGDDLGRTNFNLLAVHVLNATPYVVAAPNLCLSYNKWGRPNPPYVVFKYEGGQWQRIALSALPIEFKTINVALSTQKVQADQLSRIGLVSAERVKELNGSTEIPEFKRILREPLPTNALCPDWSSYRYTSPKAPIPILPPSSQEKNR